MDAVMRIEKGLDRKGLIKVHNEMNNKNSYNNGLVYKFAKEDCDNNSSLSWEKYLDGFIIDGKQIGLRYADRMIGMLNEGIEIKEILRKSGDSRPNILNEVEAELFLDTTPSTRMELRGENAIQKVRNLAEVAEAIGKEKPSAGDIRQFNQAKVNASDEMKKFEEKRALPKPTKKVFTAADEISFESWCIKEHGFNVLEEKPKGSMAVYALKDENVSVLFGRLNEWKSAKKIMAKLCHPDTGGNELAMSMLNDFSSLMKSLDGIKKIVDYEERVEKLKAEYSAPKKIGKNES